MASPGSLLKPGHAALRRLQREFLQLRWAAIEARGEEGSFSRTINTQVVTNVEKELSKQAGDQTTVSATVAPVKSSRNHLPSHASPASPLITSWFMFGDAASCGLLSRRRRFRDFGDGMLSYNARSLEIEFVRENKKSYRARRLAVAISLIYVWLFFALIAWWGWLNEATTLNSDLAVVPPIGSGSIHLVLCLTVITTYVLGYIFVPRNTTVGLRSGSLPSLLPLILQTGNKQFMSSYAWSSKYLALVRSLSEILQDCWLDVKELAPGDRVTQEIANAAASVRCLVIFFSYEYLRSINCTLEFLVALRYRGHPQRTVILLEAIGDEVSGKSSIGKTLTAAEARAVADILGRAVPGLLVATSVDQLLTILDENCVRATTKEDAAAVIEWWALHGSAQTARSPSDVKVIPPLLRRQLKHYWSCICSCSRRSPGDVAGGFALLSGDSKRVSWYRPPDPASLAMLGVIGVQILLHLHMFVYCLPAIDRLTSGVPAFAGSCIPDSSFIHVTSLTPFAMVLLQYIISMRPDTSSVHDDILLPLMVAAHSSGGFQEAVLKESSRPMLHSGGQIFSLQTIRFLTRRKLHEAATLPAPPLLHGAGAGMPMLLDAPVTTRDVSHSDADTAALTEYEPPHRGFSIVFVVSNSPCEVFAHVAENMSAFLTKHACGIETRISKLQELPDAAERFTMYVLLLDSVENVGDFYDRLHCHGRLIRSHSEAMHAWPTCQLVLVLLASVLSRPTPSKRLLARLRPGITSTTLVPPPPRSATGQQQQPITRSATEPVSPPSTATSRMNRAAENPEPLVEGAIAAAHPPLPVPPPVADDVVISVEAAVELPSAAEPASPRKAALSKARVPQGLPGQRADSPSDDDSSAPPFVLSATRTRRGLSCPPPVPPNGVRAFSSTVASLAPPRISVGTPTPPSEVMIPADPAAATSAAQIAVHVSEAAATVADELVIEAAETPRGPPVTVATPMRAQPPAAMAVSLGVAPASLFEPRCNPASDGSDACARARPAAARASVTQRPFAVRAKWRRTLFAVAEGLRTYERQEVPPIPVLAEQAPHESPDGGLANHLRTALFEYLLLVTGPKRGIDESSPYQSLSEALLDSIGRKVGAVIESGSQATGTGIGVASAPDRRGDCAAFEASPSSPKA